MKRVVEVPLAEGSLAVTYDRDAFLRASAEAAPSVFLAETRFPAESNATVNVLADAIVSWDLYDEDGRAYATDLASLSQLPLHFLVTVARAIEADAMEAGVPPPSTAS